MPGSLRGDLAARASREPERVALVVDGGDALTYGAWEVRSNAVARGLAAHGVRAGDRVGLLFDGRHWLDFATSYVGVVKAGAVAVLLSPGAGRREVAAAFSDSGAAVLLCPPHLAPPVGSAWVTTPDDAGRGHDTGPVAPAVQAPAAPEALIYPAAPLAPPRPWTWERPVVGPEVEGVLVHAWAPGLPAGRYAMAEVAAGRAQAATPAVFDPDRFCALVEERRGEALGLTPALAAVLASGATRDHDLSSVTRVVLSRPPSPALRTGLVAAFPDRVITVIDGGRGAPEAPAGGDDAPVAVSQEGMLWHEQFTPGSFNLPCLVRRYQGPLDTAALEGALSEIIRRHQPLRSTFTVREGEPRQVVGDHRPLKLAIVDLGGLSPDDRDSQAAALLADATARPFDLTMGPLFYPRLVRLGRDDHLLVVRLHHTVFDDWSVDVFRRELSALYAARLAGAPSPLVEPRTGFVDFCRRQHARLASGEGDAQLSWWRRELDGAPLSVQVPLGEGPDDEDGDDGRGAGAGEPLRLELPPTLAAGLRALAPQLRATPYMTVLAAFSVLLARRTGQDDLVVATVVAHRNASDVEPLVGCFTKKVPLRLRVGGDPTFAELVARTRGSLLGALSHQDVAFDRAVQEGLGGPAADHGVVPQVAVVFQGETPQQVKLALPGLQTSRFEVQGEARRERHFSSGPEDAPEDAGPVWGDGIYLGTFLILSLLESPKGMALVTRGVFSRTAARRLLEEFQALLDEVVAGPFRRVSELAGGRPAPVLGDDVVELRGFRASRSRMEAALSSCPGVAEVGVAVREDGSGGSRLVAYVVAEPGRPPPTLVQLRDGLWATLPGAVWPAAMVVVDALPRLPDGRLDVAALPPAGPGRHPPPVPEAGLLTAMWDEIGGRDLTPRTSYWQDFSFLSVLAEAREAGLDVTDEQVVRCRTPETLAAALAAAQAAPVR